MCRLKRTISGIILCALIVSLCACGKENKNDDNAAIYGEINAFYPVLLVTSQVYDDGMGNQATITCDVYYMVDGKIKNIGQIESFGTAAFCLLSRFSEVFLWKPFCISGYKKFT